MKEPPTKHAPSLAFVCSSVIKPLEGASRSVTQRPLAMEVFNYVNFVFY